MNTPIVLELAPLPREQVGPFLILALPKDADKEIIEAHWAQRVIWARKNQIAVPLEDVNWAREIISDPDKRVRADVASFNLDTTEATLRKLASRYESPRALPGTVGPLDVEKPLTEDAEAFEIPDVLEESQKVRLPEVPDEFPAVELLLEQRIAQPIDPWLLTLPSGQSENRQHE
jgi:hypothetical protein